jgi:5'-nucleotidase
MNTTAWRCLRRRARNFYRFIDVAIDHRSKVIVEKSTEIVTTWADEGPGLSPNGQVAAMVAQATAAAEPLANRVTGEAATLWRVATP